MDNQPTMLEIYARTKMCPYGSRCHFHEKGTCNYAHSLKELQAPLCRDGPSCKFGIDCAFRHPELNHHPDPSQWRSLAFPMADPDNELIPTLSDTTRTVIPREDTPKLITVTFVPVDPKMITVFFDFADQHQLSFSID